MQKRRREENRQRVIEKRKCFGCREFGHIACHYRNMEEEKLVQVPLNRFEVLKDRVIQREEESGKEMTKDRKEILREEKAKRKVEIRQTKVERKDKKEKVLREVTVKIGLKQEEEEEGIMTKALLDSGVTGLVMSKEFVRRYKFRRTKLEKPIYIRNVDSMLNYVRSIRDIVEVEIFFKGYKKKMSIDMIESQK